MGNDITMLEMLDSTDVQSSVTCWTITCDLFCSNWTTI